MAFVIHLIQSLTPGGSSVGWRCGVHGLGVRSPVWSIALYVVAKASRLAARDVCGLVETL